MVFMRTDVKPAISIAVGYWVPENEPEHVVPDPSKQTKSERVQTSLMIDAFRMIEFDLHDRLMETRMIPSGWSEVALEPCPKAAKRVKVTALFDDDVVRAFKALGPGYRHRMNRVLRAWMHGRAGKLIDGPDTTDYILRPQEIEQGIQKELRPKWGDWDRRLGAEQQSREKNKK